ncbi:hypothetical protein BCR33DRAFT_728175 [Rhizoclosmatium globosum]|uniref:CNH-domain-containing protein n=1 Tax=Rhizoclosmatium globosum TaxID=329046 RepID=A0A1Y2ALL6_9FUNG|nr:hypothetical protein BCR33DRAFT_728175 [Rhizoclosmatium globosum]|eukprot:ORY23180.1 hypothetical protein BCR33DRAFT_728175 [Rhizoclosmatium globosum]
MSYLYPAFLSHVASAFRSRAPLATHVRDGIEYHKCFLGSEAVDTIAFLIGTTDRNLALVIGRCLDAQAFIFDVASANTRLKDSSDLYKMQEESRIDTVSRGALQPSSGDLLVPTILDGHGISAASLTATVNGGVLTELPVGVFLILTDCYSPTCSIDDLCYSVSCPRRLFQLQNLHNKYKMEDIWSSSSNLLADAADSPTKMKEEDLWWSNTVPIEVKESVSKEEEKRQNAIYDIIKTEKNYVEELKIIQNLYLNPLKESNVIDPNRLEHFTKIVFCNAHDLLAVNTKLFAKLQARQKEQHIVEKIGDIFLSCAADLSCYIEYCGNREYSRNDIALEKSQNPKFREFLANAHVGSGIRAEIKHELDGYLHKPIARMASYLLLLKAIYEKTPLDHPDKILIPEATRAIEKVLAEMNSASGKTMTKIKLLQLSQQFYMGDFDLQLMDPERQMVYEGKVTLKKPSGDVSLVMFLFDHCLVMTRKFQDKKADASTVKGTRYKIYKRPIKYELIAPAAPELKVRPQAMSRTGTTGGYRPQSTYLGGISLSPKTTVNTTNTASSANTGSTAINPAISPLLKESNTLSSISGSRDGISPANSTVTPPVENRLQFSITVVGRDTGGVYTFQVDTESGRNIWREHIMKLRSKRLLGQNHFDMAQRLVDTWSIGVNPVTSNSRDAEHIIQVGGLAQTAPTSQPLTSTKFLSACDVGGRLVVATEVGLFAGPKGSVEDPENFSDQFVQILDEEKITQVECVVEHGHLLVLAGADKTLYSYSIKLLDQQNEENQKSNIIGEAINFFQVGFALNRTLVCTVRAAQLSSTIKILESVPFGTMKRKHRINFFSRGSNGRGAEAMKLFKEFYIPTEASSIHILKTKLVVGCTKGFEIVDLETLETQALLDPSDDSLDFVLLREDTKPMAIFKTDVDEYFLAYDDLGFFVTRAGRRARPDFLMKWAGSPTSFALFPPYLCAFDPSFICIRSILTGEIAQIVYATGIKSLLFNKDGGYVLGVTTAEEKQSLFRLRLLERERPQVDEAPVVIKEEEEPEAEVHTPDSRKFVNKFLPKSMLAPVNTPSLNASSSFNILSA